MSKIILELDLNDPKTAKVLAALTEVAGGEVTTVKVDEVKKASPKKAVKKVEPETIEGAWTPGGGDVEDYSAEGLAVEEAKITAPEKEYTVEDVRTIVAKARRSGKATSDQLKDILNEHGAARVSDLKPASYAAVIQAVEAL